MGLISRWNLRLNALSIPSIASFTYRPSFSDHILKNPFHVTPSKSFTVHAKNKKSHPEPVIKPTIVEEVSGDDEEDEILFDNFEDEALMDGGDDYFEDDNFEDDAEAAELRVGDGAGGGGIALAGTWWDKEALRIAEEVCLSFDGEFKIYAFKSLSNSTIQVRIESLSNKSGCPDLEDLEAFSTTYRKRLDEAELAKTIPQNVAFEVSSPGAERVVRVPEELDRFKDRSMYVKYVSDVATTGSSSESDGVFKLISFDMETKCCTWGLADVRTNREKAGKGRRLNKKQREWRLNTPFHSLILVRLYSEI